MIPFLILVWEWIKRNPRGDQPMADGLREVFQSRLRRKDEFDEAFARAIAPDPKEPPASRR